MKKYEGSLFTEKKPKKEIRYTPNADIEKLIEQQAGLLISSYGKACLGAEQLQEILGVGESNVYELMKKSDFPTRTIGKRKVVSAVALAAWLVTGYIPKEIA